MLFRARCVPPAEAAHGGRWNPTLTWARTGRTAMDRRRLPLSAAATALATSLPRLRARGCTYGQRHAALCAALLPALSRPDPGHPCPKPRLHGIRNAVRRGRSVQAPAADGGRARRRGGGPTLDHNAP